LISGSSNSVLTIGSSGNVQWINFSTGSVNKLGLLAYNGSSLSNQQLWTINLLDVSTTLPIDQQFLWWNSSSGLYEPYTLVIPSQTIVNATDYDNSTPAVNK
jgi:hypothetical protein